MSAVPGRRLAAAAALLVLAALGGCAGGGSPQPAATTAAPASGTGGATTTGRGTAAFGAWVQPTGGHDQEAQKRAVLALEAALGHRLAIDHFFVPDLAPASTFAWRLGWDARQGRTPMISFGSSLDTHQVAAGAYDQILRGYADAIRASGAKQVLIRYAHEMDGALNASWVHDGRSYVAAWTHVHGIFTGLPVQWVWAPNAPAFAGRGNGVEPYYPGPALVDWVAADGYNFYTCANHRNWRSFDQIFAPFLAWGARAGKPLMIAEFGSLQDPARPQRQAQWLADAIRQAAAHPQLKAVVYYDSDGHGCDWRLDSSPVTMSALGRLGTSPVLADG